MQTLLATLKEVLALNGVFLFRKCMGMLLCQIKVAIIAYGMFSTVLLFSFLLPFLLSLIRKSEEQLPQKTVGRHYTDSQPTDLDF